ncbi:MAG: hypothetical protein GY953_19315 [bacterium]|nr:hypothetical protein [bacterium]
MRPIRGQVQEKEKTAAARHDANAAAPRNPLQKPKSKECSMQELDQTLGELVSALEAGAEAGFMEEHRERFHELLDSLPPDLPSEHRDFVTFLRNDWEERKNELAGRGPAPGPDGQEHRLFVPDDAPAWNLQPRAHDPRDGVGRPLPAVTGLD